MMRTLGFWNHQAKHNQTHGAGGTVVARCFVVVVTAHSLAAQGIITLARLYSRRCSAGAVLGLVDLALPPSSKYVVLVVAAAATEEAPVGTHRLRAATAFFWRSGGEAVTLCLPSDNANTATLLAHNSHVDALVCVFS